MLPILPLRLNFTLNGPATLPHYPGFTWRSVLGATLRRQVCITGEPTCKGCPFITRCAYGYLFDTPQPDNATDLTAQYPDLPHPYIIAPHSPAGRYHTGETISADLTLIGPGCRFLPELLTACRNLRFGQSTVQFTNLMLLPPASPHPAGETIDTAQALNTQPVIPDTPAAHDAVRLHFDPHVRLRRRDHYLLTPESFEFATFFTTLMRRIRMLHTLAGQELPTTPPGELAQWAQNIEWQTLGLQPFRCSRRSARQNRKIPMHGLTGTIRIAGDLTPLWPWLWAGQWLHVGKGAVMGMGGYRLSGELQ